MYCQAAGLVMAAEHAGRLMMRCIAE